MTDYELIYYPYPSFMNAHLPLLKVVALYFNRLVSLDPVGASWATIGAEPHTPNTIKLLGKAGA